MTSMVDKVLPLSGGNLLPHMYH